MNKLRRKINLSALSIAGVASSHQWVKPVVNSVMLPAHAQTSNNTPAVIELVNSGPEVFRLIITDDQANFDYEVMFFTVEDPSGTVFNPPRFDETRSGNSGANSEIEINFIVSSASSEELIITVTDSSGAVTNETFRAVTP